MPLIVWTDGMSVGVKLLDNDHKKLVLLVNELRDAVVAGRARPELDTLLEGLVVFTRFHHAQEEQLLDESGYQGSAAHQLEHDQLLDQLMDLQSHFTSSAELASDLDVMNRLRVWLLEHIQDSDHEFVSHLKEKRVDSIRVAWSTPDHVAQESPAIQP